MHRVQKSTLLTNMKKYKTLQAIFYRTSCLLRQAIRAWIEGWKKSNFHWIYLGRFHFADDGGISFWLQFIDRPMPAVTPPLWKSWEWFPWQRCIKRGWIINVEVVEGKFSFIFVILYLCSCRMVSLSNNWNGNILC